MNAEGELFSIVLASRNRKKSREIAELLSPHGINVLSVADFPDVPETEEDGETFAENAAKKACETAKFLSRWAIGEDSGLMVDALGGSPGIYSARYSGEDATDDQNNRKLLVELQNIPREKRQAQYVCSVALADASGNIHLQIEARCRGRITTEAFGTNGFGYDPFFFIPEYHRTFGELSPAVKRHLSHRARAFQQLIPKLVQTFIENTNP
jgi:XTP/dITP diphosphohydrolase